MALTLADRIKQYTTSTGTGGLSFTGTPAGFAAFSSVLSSGDTTYYAVEENDKWEVGVGTYGSDNMARSQVLASSNGGNHVNLGGSGIVFITYPADKATYLNENDEYVLGASGLLFSNGTVFKDAKLTELTDVVVSGTVASTHVLALNNTNKSLLLGDITGPSNSNNTLIGYGAASGITSAHSYVSIGTESAIANDAGIEGVSIGVLSGPSETAYTNPASYVVSVGYKAGSRAKSDVTAIGHQAGMAAYETGFVAVGSAAGYGIGSYSVGVGKEAAHGNSSDYVVAVGHQAAKSAAGESAVWVGNMAGSSASSSTKSVGIGYQAGKSSSATDSIYIGQSAGQSNSDDDYLYISNGSPSSSRTLIKGDMQSKRLAVGAADVTLEDTFYIGIASSADKGLVVKSAVSQSDDLTQWQTSAGGSLASVSNLGVITANQVVASGQGLKFSTSQVPTSTTDTLYGFGGTLYWGLSPVTAPSGASGSVAFYNSTKAAIYSDDFTFDDDSNTLVVGSVSLQDKFIGINDVGKIKVGSYPGIDDGITESDYSVILGHYTAVLASGSPYSVFAGNYAGYRALNLDNSQTIGSWAAAWASGSRNVYIGGSAGVHATGNYNVFIGDRAGKECVGSQNIEIIASGDYSFSPLNGHSNKVHIGQTIIGDTDSRRLAFGLVGSSNVSPDATVEIFPKTDDLALKVHGSGEFASGVALPSAVPASTTNMLYNDAGTLKFNGSAIGGGDVTTDQLNYVSGVATYASGQAIANEADIATNVSNISTNTTNITNVTTVANYASGEALSLNAASGQVATNATNISTNTSNIATNVTDIVATSGIANYASGQAIANEADIVSTVAVANYASGEALSLNAASGQAFYASGNTANIAFGSNLEGDILYHNGTSFTRLPKGTDSHVLTMDGNVPAWEAATGGGGDVTTAQLVYVSGIAVYGSGQAESLNYASGVAAYASGNSLTNASDVVAVSGIAAYASGHVHNDLYVSGIATYASGQAIANETDIATNVSNISTNTSNISTNTTNIATNADDIVATSGIANYASGLAITNESNVAYASGQAIANETDIATNVSNISTNTSNISTNTTNITSTTAVANYASGEALSLNAASGQAVYASGQAIANEGDIVATSGISAYASGQAITNKANIATNTSNISTNTTNITSTTAVANYASGEAVSLNYASGVAVYASGQVDVATDGTAEASKALILDSAKSFAGVKNGTFDQFDSWLHSSGVSVGNSGVLLANNAPSDTSNALYNVGGTLYFNGSQLASAGGASAIAQYASGQAIENESDIVAVSGIAAYASGQAIANETDIATNVSNISTNTTNIATNVTNIASTTAVANYASGEAVGVDYVSGIAVYSSGQAIANETDIATNTSNISTNTSNISTNTTNISTNSARVTYASGQAIANEGDIVAVSGIAAYASGHVHNDLYVSGIATYASGQAIENETAIATNVSNISTNTSNISTNTSNISTNSDRVTYASGQAIANETDIVATSGIANYASGQAIANETDIATNASNISTNTSNISTNTSNVSTNSTNITATTAVANYASGEVVSLNYASGVAAYASGQAIENETAIATNVSNISTNTTNITANASNVVATSGIANYASGQAISNKASIATNTSNISTNTSNISTNVTNITSTTAVANYASGEALSLNAASGQAVYASGQAIANETDIATNVSSIATNATNITANDSDIVAITGVAGYASGQAITNKANIATNTSNISTNTSNISTNTSNISTNATNITSTTAVANYASGQVNVTTDGTAEASKALILDSAKTFTGVKDGNFSQFDSWAKASGVQVGASGVVMKDADLSHTITLKTPDVVSTSFTLPLPSGIGTNGQVLTTDSEQTYWSTVSGGGGISWDGSTANGVATFKDSDEATVESNLTFNGNTLTVATSSASAVPTVIKGDSAQTADLTSWQNSAGTSVAAMTPSGVLNTGGVVASGAITVIAEEGTPLSIQGKSTGNSVFEFKAGANQAIVNVIAGSNQNARLRLGDTDNVDSGEIYYKNSNDTLFIRGNDANRIVIGSDGRTGFGTSASAPSVGYIDVVANNGTVMCSGVRGHLLDNGTTDGTTTFDINQSTVHAITLDQNATFSVTNERAGDRFMIRVLQDGSGGHAVTWWSTIKWAGNVTPTLSAANKADLLGFLCTGTNTYDGFIVGQGI